MYPRADARFELGERLTMSLKGDVPERLNVGPVYGVTLKVSMCWQAILRGRGRLCFHPLSRGQSPGQTPAYRH